MVKNKANTSVDIYFIDGCGRCSLVGTPQCKVNTWREELALLRMIVLESGLNEERKWGVPCYTYNGNNVIMISAFKESCVISFFKGTLLKDNKKILEKPGENSQSTRWVKFTNTKQIIKLESTIKAYIKEAIELEKEGKKVELKKTSEYNFPEELLLKFNNDAAFKKAFTSLTPGRQRGYLLHFSQPKQSKTREERIEKCMPQILQGKGIHDDYKAIRK